jgi:hypothetical protein
LVSHYLHLPEILLFHLYLQNHHHQIELELELDPVLEFELVGLFHLEVVLAVVLLNHLL